MLNFHCQEHISSAPSRYWVYSFSDNQHDLKELKNEFSTTIAQTARQLRTNLETMRETSWVAT